MNTPASAGAQLIIAVGDAAVGRRIAASACVRLPHFARAGLDSWLVLDRPEADRYIRTELEERLRFRLPEDCASLVSPDARATAEVANGWCVRNAYRPIMVEEVADHLSFDRSTIARHVRRTFGLRLEDSRHR